MFCREKERKNKNSDVHLPPSIHPAQRPKPLPAAAVRSSYELQKKNSSVTDTTCRPDGKKKQTSPCSVGVWRPPSASLQSQHWATPPSTHRPPLPSEWQAEDNNTTVSLHLSPPYLLVFSLPRGLTSSSRLLWCRRQLCWISQDAAVSSSLARVCWCVWEVFVIVVILSLATLWFIKEDQIWKCLCGKAGRV